ncbi:ATP-binding protein [Streptomyces sp. NPDC059851]|uniref:ATP-binding protein n=1 Tax=Streptomyces sp. NPDC059851 TaxID=3346971 RepID=UPI0036692BDE
MQTSGPDAGEPEPQGRTPDSRRDRRQDRRLALRGVRRQVARGREFAREVLAEWGWDGHDTAEDALLVVSELLSNANLHADGCHELRLAAGKAFRVEVRDGVGDLPRLLPAPRPGVPGGHGLHVVRRLADRWGADAHEHGKVVWAEIDAERMRTGLPRRG